MPNGGHSGPARPPGEPQPAPINTQTGGSQSGRELQSWWRQFRHRGMKKEDEKPTQAPTEIFMVPLQESIRYANVAISLYDAEGHSYIYGYVPIVVAKCGVYLKEKATEVEGIFRMAGSEKRIKELRTAFNSPPRWGKGLNWDGYTVHDAANILRRYINQLPEPVVPLEFYERFREPLRNHQEQAVGPIDGQTPSMGDFNVDEAVRTYQALITELPPLNRQLLLYILDLLAVFASKSDLNKMTTPNLSAIFQPGLINHPSHERAPSEYRLSQDVLIFLIENQDHFLIGMQGTAADAQTVQEVESGPPTPQANTPTTPARSKTVLGRSGSTSSAGADSIRKYGGVRRNVSVSSRHSRNSPTASPLTPSFQTQGGIVGSGVHRSNTLPTKRSPNVPTARFGRDNTSSPSTPPTGGSTPQASERLSVPGAPEVISASSSEGVTPLAVPPNVAISIPTPTEPNHSGLPPSGGTESTQRDLPTPSDTPASESSVSKHLANIGGLFARSPSSEPQDPMRQRKKLQKKQRAPGSSNPSAHNSTHSLTEGGSVQEGPPSPLPPGSLQTTPQKDQTLHPGLQPESTPQKNSAVGATLKPTISPSHSFRSHSTTTDRDHDPSASDAEFEKGDDRALPTQQAEAQPERKEKRRWFHSKDGSAKRERGEKGDTSTPTPAGRENTMSTLGSNSMAGRSHNSVDSTGDSAPRKSFQGVSDSDHYTEDDGKKEKGSGPLGWFRGKLQERQEKKEEKARAKSPPAGAVRGEGQPGSMLSLNSSPPRNQQEANQAVPIRGRSFDAQRGQGPVESKPEAAAGQQAVTGQGQQQPQEVVLQAMGPSSGSKPESSAQ